MKWSVCFCLACLTLCACKNLIDPGLPGEEELELRWELIGNTASPDRSEASFMLANQSVDTLENNGWALYFNQMGIGVIQSSVTGNVRIEHVNGDLLRITPEADFHLEPGQTVEIRYQIWGWVISRNFSPLGPYMVYCDEEGEELATVPVKNYQVLPFPSLDKIFPAETGIPIPDADWVFEQNLKLSTLESHEVGKIIPTPVVKKSVGDSILLGEDLTIHFNEGLKQEAGYLSGMLSNVLAREPRVRKRSTRDEQVILLSLGAAGDSLGLEEYLITADSISGIEIRGGSAAGVFYGIQSLLALLPVGLWAEPEPVIELEAVEIRDGPAFPYRGVHLDLARNFLHPASVRKLIRIMAFYKLNKLHLHLTDDEGWRLEIQSLPELTEVGSCRGHSPSSKNHLMPHYGSGGPVRTETGPGCGYLSKETFTELLELAAEHHIEVIPEINFPGHARAAIYAMEARYERLMHEGKEQEALEYRLIDPEDESEFNSAQNFNDNVICVCQEGPYRFFETVVDELVEMYEDAGLTLKILHTGGDEVPKGVWAGSTVCKAFLETSDQWERAEELQAYFVGRIHEILREKGVIMAGWEEIALKKDSTGRWNPNPDFTGDGMLPYVWNDQDEFMDLGNRMANAGYRIVLCNATNLYFDQSYTHHPLEPGHHWNGYVNTRRVFEFVPFDPFKSNPTDKYWRPVDLEKTFKGRERLEDSARQYIRGLQAELWSEFIKGEEMVEYFYLPKLLGLAERAWKGDPSWSAINDREEWFRTRDAGWNEFANRIGQRELPRMDYLFGGFNYRLPPPGIRITEGMFEANSDFPGLTIRYTTDGSDPDLDAPLYIGPVEVTEEVKARSFDTRGRGSRVSVLR